MASRRRGAGPEKVEELKALHEHGWLSQHCTNVLSRVGGIPLSVQPSRKDLAVSYRAKRMARKERLNQERREATPAYGHGSDVMIDPASIVANPPGTPIEAPPAMRPDSPAAPGRRLSNGVGTFTVPRPARPNPPQTTSLRGRLEELLALWEADRSADLTAARDSTLPDCIREAAKRSADVGGIYIEELDQMYHDYLREIA